MGVRLGSIRADSHATGNRIDLSWTYPDSPPADGVRVVRREGSHPTGPDDGVMVAQAAGLTAVSDTGLRGETMYYYTLFPYTGNPPQYAPDPHNLASAMATAGYGFAERLYRLLPAIYRRYDAERLLPAGSGLPSDADKGELRRFLDLPGGELDRLYSLTRAARDLTDLNRVDARLLPLLAQWIGWRHNFSLPVDRQRGEIQRAPSIYRTVGVVPTLDATVTRVTGWTSRTKEFVHNVARTNQAERLNLWSALRASGSTTFSAPALASVNFVHDGRPTAVREADGSMLFLYHTQRQHGWDIWAKQYTNADGWQASMPIVDRPGIDKHPSAALSGDRLWLFWQSVDPAAAGVRWRIWYRVRIGRTWSEPVKFGSDDLVERRMPTAVADNTGGIWLFWLERTGGDWQLRYAQFAATASPPATSQPFPLDGGAAPRVEDDLFVLFHPTSTTQRLWLFWARHDPGGPAGQTRWSIVYRIKAGLNPAASDWSPIRALPKTDAAQHDRQPSALVSSTGDIETFWSTTRFGGWTIARAVLASGPLTWGTVTQVVSGPYTRRAPLPVDTGTGTLLAYRSNESIAYNSTTYGATHTLDHRYAGTTTVDVRDTAKKQRRGTFEDFQTYTYDAGSNGERTNLDRIARDTVGLFLTPPSGGADPAGVVDALAGVLADFMPVTTRAVYIMP